jgi:hypothetical protein
LGRLVIFDATDPDTPLGALPLADQGGYGLIVAENGPGLVRMPTVDARDTGWTRRAVADLSAEGDLTVQAEEEYSGNAACEYHRERSSTGEDLFKRALESRLARTMPSITDLRWSCQWHPHSPAFGVELGFSVPRYGRWVGRDMMLVCPRLLRDHTSLPPWKTPQEGAAWVEPERTREKVRLRLPEGLAVIELPQPWSHDAPLISCSVRYRLEGRELLFESEVIRRTGVLGREDYESLRAVWQHLDDAVRRPIVLKKAERTVVRRE